MKRIVVLTGDTVVDEITQVPDLHRAFIATVNNAIEHPATFAGRHVRIEALDGDRLVSQFDIARGEG